MSDLPTDERSAIENGVVTLYTLRKGNIPGEADNSDAFPKDGNFTHIPPNDHELVARRGFVLHSRSREGEYFHEILPYAGLIRRLDETERLADAINDPRPQLLPLDWSAYSAGTPLILATTSMVILHHLRSYRTAARGFEVRCKMIADSIKRQFAPGTREKIHTLCQGQTSFDKPDPILTFLKTWIIPIWGPLEDLIELSQQRGHITSKILASLLLVVDVICVVLPVARVVGLTTRFIVRGASLGLRAALPQLRTIAKAALVGTYQTLWPLAGSLSLLWGSAKLLLRFAKGTVVLSVAGLRQMRSLGQSIAKRIVPLRVGQQRATLLLKDSHAHRAGHVDGPLATVIFTDSHRLSAQPVSYLIEPHTGRPFGPVLQILSEDGKYTLNVPDAFSVITVGASNLIANPAPLMPFRLIQQGFDTLLETGGLHLRLSIENGIAAMRRIKPVADEDVMELMRRAPCRIARGVDMKVCTPDSVKNVGYSEAVLQTTSDRNPTDWFTDLLIQADAGNNYIHGGHRWKIENNTLTQISSKKLKTTGYKAEVTAQVLGGNLLFKKIRLNHGIVENVNDQRELSAVVATYKEGNAMEIVTRADDQAFYSASYVEGQLEVRLKRINLKADYHTHPQKNGDYLALIYMGSYEANACIKKLSIDVIENDLLNIQKYINAGGAPDIHKMINGPFDMGTSPAEAALFCHYARKAIIYSPRVDGSGWVRLGEDVPLPVRDSIARQLNSLHLDEHAFSGESLLQAGTLARIAPGKKTLAYMKVTYKDPAKHPDRVYYAVSGHQDAVTEVPLALRDTPATGWKMQQGHSIGPDGTVYINARQSRPAPGEPAPPEHVIFLPSLSPAASPVLNGNHRILDSEHMILNRFESDGVDIDAVGSVEVFSRYPTCPSCTLGLKQLKEKVPDSRFIVYEGPW